MLFRSRYDPFGIFERDLLVDDDGPCKSWYYPDKRKAIVATLLLVAGLVLVHELLRPVA